MLLPEEPRPDPSPSRHVLVKDSRGAAAAALGTHPLLIVRLELVRCPEGEPALKVKVGALRRTPELGGAAGLHPTLGALVSSRAETCPLVPARGLSPELRTLCLPAPTTPLLCSLRHLGFRQAPGRPLWLGSGFYLPRSWVCPDQCKCRPIKPSMTPPCPLHTQCALSLLTF